MRLTVLGSSASYAGPGQACSGYLVEGGGAEVLFDCGNGVLANLGRLMDPSALDAIFVTHRHPDHFLDLYSMQALLRYAPEGPQGPMPLYVPEGLFESMQAILSERGARELAEAFVPVTLAEGEPIEVGDLVVRPHLVDHTDPTFALVAQAEGVRLVYTSDTSPGQAALAASAGADLLLTEATLPEEYAGRAPHMTPAQAARLAAEAHARQLVLTHLWPTNDRDEVLSQAAAHYGGPISIATEFAVFNVGDSEERRA